MPKLTKRTVDAAKPTAKPYLLFDTEIHGFALRVMTSGEKTFLLRYRFGGADRKLRLGRYGDITTDKARTLALKARAALADGTDPGAAKRHMQASGTVKELGERFLREHVAHQCKPSTQAEYRRSIEIFINKRIGNRKVASITRPDIAELHNALSHTPYQANRTLGVISKMFNLAEVWGLRPDGSNPCRHIKKYKEHKRERYLTAEELTRLARAIDTATRRIPDGDGNYIEGPESPHIRAAFMLLILTGCRLGEIQTLKWEYVRNDCIELPDSKTGAKVVPLGPEAIAVLRSIPRSKDNPYVIVGEVEGQYATDLQRPWRRIRKLAGLDTVRIHDLRHTFASMAISNGESLYMVGKMLGHTQPQTTARYAHLARAPLQAATSRVSGLLGAALSGKTLNHEAGKGAT